MKSLRHAGLVVAGFSACYVIYFSSVFLAGKYLAPEDAALISLPFFLPPRSLWTSMLSCGYPQYADPQAQFFYPLSLFLSMWSGAGWNWFVVVAYVIASCTTYGYIYSLTGRKFAALLGALIFGLSGYLISHLCHVMILHTACWFPLVVWALHKMKNAFPFLWFCLGSTAITMMVLGGHPQTLAYALPIFVVFALNESFENNEQAKGISRFNRSYLLRAALMIILGIGMGSIQLVPMFDLVIQNPRLGMGHELYNFGCFQPVQFLLFIFPFFLGSDQAAPYGLYHVGPNNFGENACYLGFLPLLLVPCSLVSNPQSRRCWFWLGVAVTALILAMAEQTPIGALAYYLPCYGHFRCSTRHLFELSFAVAVLAALGASNVSRGLVRHKMTIISCLSLVAVVVVSTCWALRTISIMELPFMRPPDSKRSAICKQVWRLAA